MKHLQGWVAEVDLKKKETLRKCKLDFEFTPRPGHPFEPNRMAESSCSAAVTPLGFLWNGFIGLTLHHNLHLKWTPNSHKSSQSSGTQATEWDILQCPCICTSCNNLLLVSTSHPLSPGKAMSLGVLIVVWRSISQPLVGLSDTTLICFINSAEESVDFLATNGTWHYSDGASRMPPKYLIDYKWFWYLMMMVPQTNYLRCDPSTDNFQTTVPTEAQQIKTHRESLMFHL